MIATSLFFWDKPSWGEAEVWAVIFLLVPSVLLRQAGQPFLLALITGKDNRWSTSKANAVLWTYGILFAFLTILLHTRGEGLNDVSMTDQYLLLLGIPIGGAVTAAAITQSKTQAGMAKPSADSTPNVLEGVGQLVSNDEGESDLLDAQYLGFSVLLLGYFLAQFLSAESLDLPTLPATLVGLTGVSAVGYVAKKGVQDTP